MKEKDRSLSKDERKQQFLERNYYSWKEKSQSRKTSRENYKATGSHNTKTPDLSPNYSRNRNLKNTNSCRNSLIDASIGIFGKRKDTN